MIHLGKNDICLDRNVIDLGGIVISLERIVFDLDRIVIGLDRIVLRSAGDDQRPCPREERLYQTAKSPHR